MRGVVVSKKGRWRRVLTTVLTRRIAASHLLQLRQQLRPLSVKSIFEHGKVARARSARFETYAYVEDRQQYQQIGEKLIFLSPPILSCP